MKLRHLQAVLHGEHAGGVPQDALLFGERAGEHPGVVGQEHARQPERAGHVQEVRGLIGSIAVDGAGPDARVVGDEGHAASPEMGGAVMIERPKPGWISSNFAAVHHRLEHGADGVGAARVGRDESSRSSSERGPPSGPSRSRWQVPTPSQAGSN